MEEKYHRNNYQDKRIDKLEEYVFNHLTEKIGEIKTDLVWLKKFFWIVATASVSSLIINLIK